MNHLFEKLQMVTVDILKFTTLFFTTFFRMIKMNHFMCFLIKIIQNLVVKIPINLINSLQ